MWINIGTRKEENKVWVEFFSKANLRVENTEISSEDLTEFLLKQLAIKATADLRKSQNPTEDAKTWKPEFGRKKKTKIDKIKDQFTALSEDDKAKIRDLLKDA